VSRVFETWEEADQSRDPDTEMVCGVVMEDKSPRYFVVSRDTEDDVIAERAFEIRNGRPVSSYERTIRELAERRAVPV
jgi:hypothetical protein